jgi:hypothetical protein
MTATTDWDAWHDDYADESSALSRRLRVVQSHIRAELDATAPRALTVVSACAGDGRDLLQVLAGRTDASRVTAHLFEQDARCVARARAEVDRAGLHDTSVIHTDASSSDAYRGYVPADIVLVCGIFGNVGDDDVEGLVHTLPQLCRTGALVLWTRHRRAPDLTPRIRTWLESAGFDEVAFTAPSDVVFTVGASRFRGPSQPLVPGRRLFTFVR